VTPAATAAARAGRAAPARRAPARPAPERRPQRAPARRAAPARSPSRTTTARLFPLAVGRTASAVSGLADTGVFVRLTRGRLWIGLLTALLVGIVAINVVALSFGATASKLGREADGLRQTNSALRAQLAGRLSDLRVQSAAIRAGLIVPGAGSIRYVHAHPGDAAIAASRLRSGDLSYGSLAATALSTSTLTASTTVPTTTTLPTTAATTAAPTTTTTPTATTTVPSTTTVTPATTTATPTTAATTPTAAAPATATGGVAAP
jgi:hypothetical protein